MSLPALPNTADTRAITERANVLIRDFNGRRSTVAVVDLPDAPAVGERWMVNDANATTFWSVVAGGGANVVPVTWDGADWRIG